jgi:hypothetical protein
MAAHKGPASLRPRCTQSGSSIAVVPICQSYCARLPCVLHLPWLALCSIGNFIESHSLHYLFINLFILIRGATSELVQLIKYNYILTKGKPTVTSFPNTQSAVLDYHTTHHLTHTAVIRLASYWTAHLRYLLLTIFLFRYLSVHNISYHQRFLNVRWAFKLIMHGCELPVTNARKPNKRIYQKCWATLHRIATCKFSLMVSASWQATFWILLDILFTPLSCHITC